MSQLNDGSFVCDKCDSTLESDSIANAARVAFLGDDGNIYNLHYCMTRDDKQGTKRCAASTVVSETNMKGWKTRNPDKSLRVFSHDRDLNSDGTIGNG